MTATDSQEPSPIRQRVRFRITHLLYATALIAASIATFGPAGVVLGLMILTVWILVFTSRTPGRMLLVLSVLLLSGTCLFGLLLPGVSAAREAARPLMCRGHLKQISLAMLNYYDTYGSFPPAYTSDKSGRPMHSWRILILPYLDEQKLYDAYDMDEPWNGPNNRKLANRMPAVYACPSHDPGEGARELASYVVVVDDDTAWPHERTTRFQDFPDGMNNTILVLEGEHDVPWMKPGDIDLESALDSLAERHLFEPGAHRFENFFYVRYMGRNVAFIDGRVKFLYHPLDRTTASELFKVSDGASMSHDDTEHDYEYVREVLLAADPPRIRRRLKLGNCLRLSSLILLSILPLPWVWLGRGANRTATLH